eukprot:2769715-Amphidinium_carterae.1
MAVLVVPPHDCDVADGSSRSSVDAPFLYAKSSLECQVAQGNCIGCMYASLASNRSMDLA